MQVTRTGPSGCSTGGLWKKAWGWRNVWTKCRLFRSVFHRARDARVRRGAQLAFARSAGFHSHRKRHSDGPLPKFKAGLVESGVDVPLKSEDRRQKPEARSQNSELSSPKTGAGIRND